MALPVHDEGIVIAAMGALGDKEKLFDRTERVYEKVKMKIPFKVEYLR